MKKVLAVVLIGISLVMLLLGHARVLAAVIEEWNQTFGGSNMDFGHSVIQTTDGGYVITGYTQSYGAGSSDVWLIKADSSGNKEWDKTFGDTDTDRGYSVCQTSDGGYIIAGTTRSYGAGDYDAWLIKTDSSGNKTWDKTFGDTDPDSGYSVCQTSDGGYIITGHTDYDVWLIKTDSSGDKEWDKTFGGTGMNEGHSVIQTSDGGYIVAGYTNSQGAGSSDVWLIKTDSSGNKTWDMTFGGTGMDYSYSIKQTPNEGYVFTGFTDSYGAGNWDVWLLKVGEEATPTAVGGTIQPVNRIHVLLPCLFALSVLCCIAIISAFLLRKRDNRPGG